MSNVLYFPNLKRSGSLGPVATGTQVGTKTALDVCPANTPVTPLYVSGSPLVVRESRFHDTASTAINASGGAWVQIATAADVANTIAQIKGAWNGDEPIAIGVGANAGAVTVLANIAAGEDFDYGAVLAAGDKIWVKSLTTTAPSGRLTVNLMG
jgi:hypothetical protein